MREIQKNACHELNTAKIKQSKNRCVFNCKSVNQSSKNLKFS